MDDVIVDKKGRAGVISLNRPKAMNALNLRMIRAIDAALTWFQKDAELDFVVLRSNHDRAFCAGGDMRAVRELVLAEKFAQAERFFEEEYALIKRIATFEKPYISLIDGVCMGGGLGLSVHGDYRIATERALFAMPETMIGFFPDVGGSHFLSRMPSHAGIWMGLTGASVRGFDAHGLGISTHMTVADCMGDLFDALCYGDARLPDILDEFCASLGYQPDTLLLSDTTHCFNQPTLCSIMDCLEKHTSKRREVALNVLRKASPRSLQETLTLLRNGQHLSLVECLDRELEAMRRAIRHPDLAEGVRAVLVDKDHDPNWASFHNIIDSGVIAQENQR
ncbi:enoyl-CoA hydratase/isomerase family protein [Shimia sp. R11_0]|uniref:enoyl-CoA hydratase/isomerase family protein n=1 Tax=Shimia sp. R11_0 TaxID=2821096 RepID=UPI001ADA8FA5|nr:enoyl-CoA hydratase/isomerase family protein [Shimia sp. R11_0]MBO9477147.1 enoyl-CoA hydratase/isomerase family protein [Shimia sp. R11_0]